MTADQKCCTQGSVCAKELVVKFDELSQESSVGNNTTVLLHSTNRLHQGQVLVQHQVSQDQGGGPAHANMTMNQHLA